jgi:hypothetical protein
MLDFVDPAHVALIESVQPYQPTGLTRLAKLERFSNTDKHRLIHAAVTNLIDAPAINFSRVIRVAVTDVTYPHAGEPVTDGTEIARFKGDVGLNLAPQPDGRFAVLNSSMHVEAGFQAGTHCSVSPVRRTHELASSGLRFKDIRELVKRF